MSTKRHRDSCAHSEVGTCGCPSESPAVGPDPIRALAQDAYDCWISGAEKSLDKAMESLGDALAASGVGPTEPSAFRSQRYVIELEKLCHDAHCSTIDGKGQICDCGISEILDELRARVGPTEPSEPDTFVIDGLANFIRTINGSNRMGAGELAERIAKAGYLRSRPVSREQEPASDRWFTPQPVDAPPREKP